MATSDSTTKTCTKCGNEYPATDEHFRKRSDNPNAWRSWCRYCLREDGKQYQLERRKNPEVVAHEREYDRRRYLLIREQKLKRHREYERQPEVKARRKAYSFDYERTPERRLKRRARAAIQHSKRRNAAGRYSSADVRLLLRSQKGLCWWCGKPAGENYEVDHRIPLSRGGSNYPENLCISCFDCNRSKHDKLPQEWNGRLL